MYNHVATFMVHITYYLLPAFIYIPYFIFYLHVCLTYYCNVPYLSSGCCNKARKSLPPSFNDGIPKWGKGI
jgi:hypothetical protein